MDTNNKDISRRDFLKIVGISTAASTAVLAGCAPKGDTSSGSAAQGEIPADKMTMRVNPKTGEKVSLLGYGCMRWPTLEAPEKGGNVIDQDAVNRLIDYAMVIMVSLCVVLTIRLVGIMLLLSMLTIPQMTVELFTRRYRTIMLASGLLTVVGGVVGLWLAYVLDVPAGACIVFFLIALYAVTRLGRSLILHFQRR